MTRTEPAESVVGMPELWEALAQDIHANGNSVRDAIAKHRLAIEEQTRLAVAPDARLREALNRLVRAVIAVKLTPVGQTLFWGDVNLNLDRAEALLSEPKPASPAIDEIDRAIMRAMAEHAPTIARKPSSWAGWRDLHEAIVRELSIARAVNTDAETTLALRLATLLERWETDAEYIEQLAVAHKKDYGVASSLVAAETARIDAIRTCVAEARVLLGLRTSSPNPSQPRPLWRVRSERV